MGGKEKIKYEKPKAVDMGNAAPVLGQSCSGGSGADGCITGTNPFIEPSCPAGTTATNNCQPVGGAAGDLCNNGTSPGWCFTGGAYSP